MKTLFGNIILTFLLCVQPLFVFAQGIDTLFVPPFDFPLLLSGNFGEVRTDHFHSGVDFKTQGVVGKPIISVVLR